MTTLKILLMLFALVSLACQTQTANTAKASLHQTTNTADASLRLRERELAARLRWEILWDNAPLGLRVPEGGTARLAAYQTGNYFWYCSRDLEVCAQYSLDHRQLGHRLGSIKCSDAQDDTSSVLQLAGVTPKPLPFKKVGTEISNARPDGILWNLTLKLSTREKLVKQYKQLRPTELKGLRDWLRTKYRNTGYQSMTIACFAPSDRTIFIYGNRPAKHLGPIVFQVYWDGERKEGYEAGMMELSVLLERGDSTEKFEELKAMVQAIACDTIRFD